MKRSRMLMLFTTCALVAAPSSGAVARAGDLPKAAPGEDPAATDAYAAMRERMVQRHLVERGIKDSRVLDAFRTVPRHRFVPPESRRLAYEDVAIPIGEGQTISPPYDVAFMTQALRPEPTDKVYEVGTGSGFQASILSQLVAEVYSVEIHPPLGERAAGLIRELGYTNVHTRVGDGYAGWPEAAPFDAIIVTCAPKAIPAPLIRQLKEGGRMIIPLGDRYLQKLYILEKRDGRMVGTSSGATLFVPMTGRALADPAAPPPAQP